MPIYTYKCRSCGIDLERRQTFADAPLTQCESCGGELRRLLHPVGVIFKGSGFYNTDYKKVSAAPGAESASGDGGDSAKTTPDAPKADAAAKSGESTPAGGSAAPSSSDSSSAAAAGTAKS